MLTQNNIIIIFYSLPIYQLLFYTIQLISFKRSNPSRRYLGFMLLIMTAFLVINATYNLGYNDIMKWLYYVYIPLLLALPPFYYLYVSSLINKNQQIKPFSKFVLFIPPLFVLILNLLILGFGPQYKIRVFLGDDHTLFGTSIIAADVPLLLLWFSLIILFALQLFLSVIKVKSLLTTEAFTIQEHPSHLAHLQIKWVNIISISIMVFIIANTFQILFIGPAGLSSSIAFNSIILVSSGLTGYFGMKQDALLTEVSRVGPVNPSTNIQSNIGLNKTQNGMQKSIDEAETNQIIERIDKLLHEKKPFLNKRFSIDDLCEQIDVKRNKVTPVINEVMGKNFHGLINDYRVLEAIRVMEKDINNLTIDGIATMVGFHSRSSFYACFKKYTGLTPKEFLTQKKNTE